MGPLQAGMLNFTQINYPTLPLINQNATPSLSHVRHHARSSSVLNFEVTSLDRNQIQSGPVEQEGFKELPSSTGKLRRTCHECGQELTSLKDFKRHHTAVHEKRRPYRCTIAGCKPEDSPKDN
ncbi:uncharacterized protein PADG_11839 [Paracoccidioides brasiliensis Pb18]|uniref:C2H2-type domain-containing protein n=1 Tax=Paracoccidioides brasiliensis (strain Pb18) TaxID=502780 RepID=A0A0A0HUM0_PARBD|nr:uncharacterized protein PADG_11839 [Paracoccidioides brasiliensis Pb18]KGM92048.1 hypothetical protein PADG_11839 [Paracoccidioides brasiliensis Pb18]